MKRKVFLFLLLFALGLVNFVSAEIVSKCSILSNEVIENINEIENSPGRRDIIRLLEGDYMKLGEYTVVPGQDDGIILKLDRFENETYSSTTDRIEFVEVSSVSSSNIFLSDRSHRATISKEGEGTVTIGGIRNQVLYVGANGYEGNGYVRLIRDPVDETETFGNCDAKYCRDSDGGKDFKTKGLTEDLRSDERYEDKCTNDVLSEYFCDQKEEVKLVNHQCLGDLRCFNGECTDEECIEDWDCRWGACNLSSGYIERISCKDLNKCGTEINKPAETSRSCSSKDLELIEKTKQYQKEKEGKDKLKKTGNWCEIGIDTVPKVSYIRKISGRQVRVPSITKDGSLIVVEVYTPGTDKFILTGENPTKEVSVLEEQVTITLISANESAAELRVKYCVTDTCDENWFCEEWEDHCQGENLKRRTCFDINECETVNDKPKEIESCDTSQELQMEGSKKIIIGETEIETDLESFEENNKRFLKTSEGNKEIKILPEQAILNANLEKVDKIRFLEESGLIVYRIQGTKKVKIFFIIPVEAMLEQSIDIETGELVSSKKPWWSVFASGI